MNPRPRALVIGSIILATTAASALLLPRFGSATAARADEPATSQPAARGNGRHDLEE